MKIRFFAMLAIFLLVAACAVEPATDTEPAAEAEAEAEAPAMDEEAAVDAVRQAYMEHYNAGDAEALADLFTEDAVTLFADGGVNMGREAIAAAQAEVMASDPTADIQSLGVRVMGDMAVDHGSYEIQMTPEGAEPMSFGGSYMSMLREVDGEWKLGGVISNYDSEPPAGIPPGETPEAPPEEAPADNPLADALASYQELFNAGDAAGVAGLYAEDAWAAYANRMPVEGREAIQEALAERMAAGSPQMTIHLVGVQDLGEGWYAAGGWAELMADGERGGLNWMGLFGTAEDGSVQMQWVVTNNVSLDGM